MCVCIFVHFLAFLYKTKTLNHQNVRCLRTETATENYWNSMFLTNTLLKLRCSSVTVNIFSHFRDSCWNFQFIFLLDVFHSVAFLTAQILQCTLTFDCPQGSCFTSDRKRFVNDSRLHQSGLFVLRKWRLNRACRYQLSIALLPRVTQWFNNVNYSDLNPSVKEIVFGLFTTTLAVNKALSCKFIMQCYIYTSKLRNRSITLSDFVKKQSDKYNVEQKG